MYDLKKFSRKILAMAIRNNMDIGGFMEEWRPINAFHGYSVSDQGKVLNTKTGRIMSLSENQKAILFVGMIKGGVQYKRAVCLLVADAFLPAPVFPTFDSVINLDGDRHNNFASNLDWRPLWFARKYHQQFIRRVNVRGTPIADMETGEEFFNVWDAAIKYGLLVSEIVMSIENHSVVWPTHQRFWRLK